MKQIPLLQAKVLLVELPDGATDYRIFKWPNWIRYRSEGIERRINLPPGNWRIIGMLSEVTEEHAAGMVSMHVIIKKYRDYQVSSQIRVNDYRVWPFRTALESLESAILAEGWYFQHPQGDTPLYYTDRFTGEQKIRADWEYGLSRVLDRSRCLLLGRESN